MGIAATVTFFIPRWRPAPWATTYDIANESAIWKSRLQLAIRKSRPLLTSFARSRKFGNLRYGIVIRAQTAHRRRWLLRMTDAGYHGADLKLACRRFHCGLWMSQRRLPDPPKCDHIRLRKDAQRWYGR
jgi:hypothetical protein